MLKRKIKGGKSSRNSKPDLHNIDENQNIIDNLSKALEIEEKPKELVKEKTSPSGDKNKKQKSKQIKLNTKFGQGKLRHARRGISSCLLALMGIFILWGLITSAYQSYGQAPEAIGGLAILTTLFCITGLLNGIHGFRERDKNYISCKLGILLNGGIIFIFFLLYMRGLR